jgi:hypothetical protein
MKILLLFIYSKSVIFDKMLEIQRKYIHNNENIDAYFVTFDEEQSEEIRVVDDIIYVKGKESHINILYKTMKAFDFIINTQKQIYDYVVRSNMSTIINFKNLYTYLDRSPKTMFYSGGFILTLLWPLAPYEICQDRQNDRYSYYGLKFVQGTSIILSKDVINTILNHDIEYDIVDDVKIAILVKEILFEAYQNFESIELAKSSYSNFTEDNVFIRNVNDNREADICNMENIIQNF